MKNSKQVATTLYQTTKTPWEHQLFVDGRYEHTINTSQISLQAAIEELREKFPNSHITSGKTH